PSISGMDPPFGDAFENYTFADQALTSTDLLANSTDPDFMYELDTDMTCRQSPRADVFSQGDCKEIESMEHFAEILDSDPNYNSNFEQWDSYWEDLTKYTRLASCEIWGTKEVDFLGLDDFSSPYQDEEVIGRTPTLAQLNSEDSQPVGDILYHSDLLLSQKPLSLPPSANGNKVVSLNRNSLPDFAEGSQKATWPVPSCTETMSKTQTQVPLDSKDYMRKAKTYISVPCHPAMSLTQPPPTTGVASLFAEGSVTASTTTTAPTLVVSVSASLSPNRTTAALSIPYREKKLENPRLEVAPRLDSNMDHQLLLTTRASQSSQPTSGLSSDVSRDKEEEHNYSLFVTQGKPGGRAEQQQEEEEVEGDELEEVELDDEDHDEEFGSEHEFSENEEEDEDEEEDYEDDKDDDMSDSFSEPGCDNDAAEDVKGMASGLSRKRGKRRYFWEYSEQLTPCKQERMLKPSEWDRETLPSNMYQRNGLHHGRYAVKKSRRTDVEDLTPNPRKLLQIGNELHKLNKVISDLTPVSELPLTARPRSRKEKNKLASRACRLKKKAQYEANKVKLWGLSTEYDRLLFVINAIKEDIVNRVQNLSESSGTSLTKKLEQLIKDTLVKSPVAGQTSEFVNQILENTAGGDPTGGLVGLRVPTSKV
ncbi:CREB3 regulatory factor-like, partial [Scleropages formosus]